MNPLLESVYYRCPVFLQNAAVTALGIKLRAERYRQAGETKLNELMQTQYYNSDQMQAYQSAAFVKLARHAIENTAYYNAWAKQQGVIVQDIQSIEDIKKFPIVEKSFIRENAHLFKALPILATSKPVELHTSGTTGTPLKVYTDQDSRSEHYAFFSRLRSWYGISPIDRRATLFGRIIMPASQKQPPFWRYDAAQKNLLMSSYHLKKENLIHYYNKLKDYQPQEIFSYPSSIAQLADFIIEQGLEPLELKLLMTTAEHLHDHQRIKLQQAFNAPVVNQYGCTEMAFFVSNLPDGDFCFHPEHGIAEVRNEKGQILDSGNGELIATGLINFSMPVIRYAMGDNVELGQLNGHGFKKLLDVHGRKDDVIYMSDGTPVGRLDPIFKGGAGIKSAQILQKKTNDIVLKIETDTSYKEENGLSLLHELKKRVGNLNVVLQIVDEIPRGKNGKLAAVIREK